MAVAVDVRDILRRLGADVLVLRQLRIELPVFHPIDGIAPAAADANDFYARAGKRRIVVKNNINAFARLTDLRCHGFVLSSKTGSLPRPFSFMLGWLYQWRLYLADNILCRRAASIQHFVKEYY